MRGGWFMQNRSGVSCAISRRSGACAARMFGGVSNARCARGGETSRKDDPTIVVWAVSAHREAWNEGKGTAELYHTKPRSHEATKLSEGRETERVARGPRGPHGGRLGSNREENWFCFSCHSRSALCSSARELRGLVASCETIGSRCARGGGNVRDGRLYNYPNIPPSKRWSWSCR
jgi:hypothetical protein